ncbi:hypothetical protein GA0070616_5304 [Micromonospora nigra]|uniref:Uncharacterized protein n=1 Tax=Micromonospora nigra TaxID=145857 RepID=A0A1C6T2X7_9ACTN|nr:hypothetical protein [Micromonospora nigra]SCL35735.1 hypothetical protein GA0070616_5304 [Micromonospora nigra]
MPNSRTAVLTAGLTGLALTLAGCTAPAEPVAPTAAAPSAATSVPEPTATPEPTASPEPTTSGSASAEQILDGNRQIHIHLVEPAGTLHVTEEGRLTIGPAPVDSGLLVLVPSGNGTHLIMTAATANGEPSCMGIRHNGISPLTVVAAACDARRGGQLFTIRPVGNTAGEPAYSISSRSAYLQRASSGELIAEELGDAPLRTTFRFDDQGVAPARPGE